jgi:enamine deaminase RidA (YjgF/YER057c/UK114 family)
MTKTILNPASLANPAGYAHGVLASGTLLFLAGQTGMDVNGRITAPGDLVGQFRQALANIKAVLDEAGGQMNDVVKLTMFVTDKRAYHDHLKPIGAAYRDFFGRYFPAMTLVEVKSLFDDEALIEIDGMAMLPGERPHGL